MGVSSIPATYYTKFASNMRMALNQQAAVLLPKAMRQSGSGEMQKLDNIVGNGKVKKRTTRNADVNYDDTPHDGVWVAMPGQDYDADLVDTLDKLASVIDLQGAYTMKHAGTIRRGQDGAFIGGFDGTGGFYGNMLMGKRGELTVPFANANIVPVSTGAAGPTGMNISKVIEARTCLVAGHVDPNQPFYFGVTANEVKGLFQQAQVTSSDFQQAHAVRFSADGKSLLGIMGFEFVEVELNNPDLPWYDLTRDANGYQKNPFWSKDGMCAVWWQDVQTSLDILPQKHRSVQVLTDQVVTATRTDNARCGFVLNN